eukprot:GGOE01015664.1.p1 GENE.GGOE01015664.1~~GGOE01015664.1.p1  ORF type:complete len:170 (-),score=21.15 GGOE01015664.1:107-616(-)
MLTVCAEASGDALPLAAQPLTHRLTTPPMEWALGPWQRGMRYRSPDLSAMLQGVVWQPDWRPGQHLLLLLTSTGGSRMVCAFDGAPDRAPCLHMKYFGTVPLTLGGLTSRLITMNIEEQQEEEAKEVHQLQSGTLPRASTPSDAPPPPRSPSERSAHPLQWAPDSAPMF